VGIDGKSVQIACKWRKMPVNPGLNPGKIIKQFVPIILTPYNILGILQDCAGS
jgi:hypothetical protein